jgi:alkylation response protein AidB-like acyl-CoA dehydrogenase
VDFSFTDDQLAFRDAVRDLLARECPPSVVRDAWTNANGRTDKVWARLAEMGVFGADEPLTTVDEVLVLEESGFAAVPEPLVEHMMVALSSPHLTDDEEQRAERGEITITAALGEGTLVPYADSAELVVVERNEVMHLVPRASTTLEHKPSVDGTRRLFAVSWDLGSARCISNADQRDEAFDFGALGTAAQLVGLARRMLDMTVAYVTDRNQFGVPVGSFQAVKHHLADARIALEFARPLVYRAAWSMSEDDPQQSVHVSMAKAMAGDAARLTAAKALQCHGAIGYSYEYDLHLFMKRAWALAAAWGDASWHRARVGRAIL